MEATAVNPTLQSAILNKFGNPFGQATQKIVENMDLTVDKQEVLVEKQDKLGDKVKEVVSNLEGAGANFSDAFSRSSDGLKELTFGFLDIKGIIEEVGKKFQALSDFFAPLAEISSFFVVSGLGQRMFGKKGGGTNDAGSTREKNRRKELGFVGRLKEDFTNIFAGFRKVIGKVVLALRGFLVGLIPITLQFLIFGGLFAIAVYGITQFIKALGGWNLVESFIDNVVIGLKSLQLAFLKATKLFGGEDKKKKIREVEGELRFQKTQKEDKKRVREIEEASKDEKGVINLDKVKEQVEKEDLVSSKYGSTIEKNAATGAVTIMNASGNVILDPKIQQKLDYLAIKAKLELPKLKESVEKDGENVQAKAALTAAEGFITEYNRTYGDEKLDNVMGSYKKFQDEQGRFQDKSLETFLVTQDEGGMRENLDKYNPMGGRGDIDFATFVYGSKKIGDTIKKEIDETKTSDFIDSKGEGGYLARISAPNIATQINNAYQLDAIPTSKESIADSI